MKQCSLLEAREGSGLPASHIADTLQISRSQLYRIESGQCQASFEVARRIRRYWPLNKVPDLAIYDPQEYENRRKQRRAA